MSEHLYEPGVKELGRQKSPGVSHARFVVCVDPEVKTNTNSQLGNGYRGKRSHGGPYAPLRCPQTLSGIVGSKALDC